MEKTKSLTISKRQSRRVGPDILTDLDFTDIALISDEIEQTQQALLAVDEKCASVGHTHNDRKT